MTTTTAPVIPCIGGIVHQYAWMYQGQSATIAYETLGQGLPVLLLPAFSTVSTRQEMAGIAQVLAPHFQVIALDWLGFGDSDRPAWVYDRLLYRQLLQDFMRHCCPQPPAMVAAGHGAGYALQVAQQQPYSCSKLVLVAPTWKGPLRAMGAPRPVASGVRNLVRSPLLGQALYGLNTTPAFLKLMYRRHVYGDASQLTPKFIAHKHAITQQPGARFAPAAFVTAALDPFTDSAAWLAAGRALDLPVQVIIPEQAPPQSTAEMEALAALPGIQSYHLPGSLGLHEEHAAKVGALALAFLQAYPLGKAG
ncbi:MAG: alpha/beta fold hydrolase [Nodosilinea sp.]